MRRIYRRIDWTWIGLSLGLLAAVGSWSLLSRSFVYGQGHADRPILLFLALFGAAWAVFAVAAVRILRGDRPRLSGILFVAVCARLLLLPSSLIQENDVYRYVLDGQVLLHGGNPYALAPLEVAGRQEFLPSAGLDSPQAEFVLSRVGYPQIPTVYPPLAQAAFALGAAAAGWNWHGQRWVFMTLDLFVLLLVVALLKRSGLAAHGALLYGWNPLVLKEVSNSCHLDALTALCILTTLWLARRYQAEPSQHRAALAGAALGLAILSKLYPVLLIPVLIALLWRQRVNGREWLAGVVSCAVIVIVGYVPFLGIGWGNLTRGLSTFARVWKMNEGAFGLLDAVVPEGRWVAALMIGGAAVVVPWLRRDTAGDRVIADAFWVLLIWFLLIPTPYPWYAIPILSVSALMSRARPLLLTLSGVLALYYLSFFIEYGEYDAAWWTAIRAVEHLAIWAMVGWTIWGRRPSVVSAPIGG